jgi:hypothetical protein
MAKKYTADTFEGAVTGTASGNVAKSGDTMTGTLTLSNSQIQINSSTSQARLNLNNTALSGDSQINFQLSGSSKFTIGVDDSNGDKFIISGGNSIGSSDRLIIDSNGYVSINDTSNQGGYRLNVNGDIGASTGSQLYMYQSGGTGSTNAVIRVTNLDTSSYGQTTPNFYSDAGNYYGNRHCEFATNGTVRGYIGHNGSVNVTYSTTSSDERLKKNIEVWDEDTLGKFRNIEPKKFNFIDQEDTDPKERGYIAQNMVDNFPEAYPHDFSISQTEGMYSFNPSGMVVYLMKAVKDLITENDNLKARVEVLENA